MLRFVSPLLKCIFNDTSHESTLVHRVSILEREGNVFRLTIDSRRDFNGTFGVFTINSGDSASSYTLKHANFRRFVNKIYELREKATGQAAKEISNNRLGDTHSEIVLIDKITLHEEESSCLHIDNQLCITVEILEDKFGTYAIISTSAGDGDTRNTLLYDSFESLVKAMCILKEKSADI
jgi:hypothetical protein